MDTSVLDGIPCNGHYIIKMVSVGTKLQVWNGSRDRTPGGLSKKDLTTNKHGKVVSKKAQAAAKKKSNLKHYIIRPRSTRTRKKPVRYS